MTTRTSAGLLLCAVAILLPAGGAVAAPPNVVVILADDLGFSDLGCYGGEIDTPHLDRLAAGGLRFTQGTNTARCWPTRGALLTGYHAQAIRRDALPGGRDGKGTRPAWARLLPELLATAGYRSYHSGKWHVDGDPRPQGFARSLDVTRGESNYFSAAGIVEDGEQVPATGDFYATTAIGDHAVKCLAEHARDHAGRPFFQYVAFTAPHFPLQAPADLVAKYRDRYRSGWNAVQEARVRRLAALGIVTTSPAAMEREVGPPYRHPEAVERLGPGEVDRPVPWEELSVAQREFQAAKMAVHAAMVESLDRQVGRIVAALEAGGMLDDTLLLFASDNGASAEIMIRGEGHDPLAPPGSRQSFLCLGPGWSSCANTPFRRHKTWVHEGGIATPWIVHWPRGRAARGGLEHRPVHVVDVVPTVLELAGVAAPREHAGRPVPPFHGRSFAAALAGGELPPRGTLWWCHEGHRAVREGDWKLVAAKGGPWELYDLARDRCETRDLAAAEPARVATRRHDRRGGGRHAVAVAAAETAEHRLRDDRRPGIRRPRRPWQSRAPHAASRPAAPRERAVDGVPRQPHLLADPGRPHDRPPRVPLGSHPHHPRTGAAGPLRHDPAAGAEDGGLRDGHLREVAPRGRGRVPARPPRLRPGLHPRRGRHRAGVSGQLRRRAGQPLLQPRDPQRREVREHPGLLHRRVLQGGARLDRGPPQGRRALLLLRHPQRAARAARLPARLRRGVPRQARGGGPRRG
ncbi:MAG: hypothetical protein EBX36_01330, partial [Planctomycetia bacterium]|nr:hypothetical protein [Planctomycetia bacterium]